MSFRILVSFIVVFLGLEQGQCMEFDITPRKATEMVTKQVTLTCRTDTPREVVLIQISRGDDESVAMLRGNGKTISYGNQGSRRFEAFGDVGNMTGKGGYLSVIMHFPSNQDTGIYKCHVVYLGDGGVASYSGHHAYLDVDKSSPAKTEARIQSLEKMLMEMNETWLTNKVHAFSAAISHKSLILKNSTIIFDDVITQQGQGYNPQDGTFTAPISGLYAFFLALGLEGEVGAGFSIQSTENRDLAKVYLEDKDLGDQSSVSSVVTLKAGQGVRVVVAYKTEHSGFLYHMKYSVFSGFLVRPML